jgi:hypothetical protein
MPTEIAEKNVGVLTVSASESVDSIEAQGFDVARTKKLIGKLDWHLIPFLSLIYLYVFPSNFMMRKY